MKHIKLWIVRRASTSTRFGFWSAAYAYHLSVLGSSYPVPVYEEDSRLVAHLKEVGSCR